MKKYDNVLIIFITVTFLETSIFAFVFTGWSSYVYVLISDGYYAGECVNEILTKQDSIKQSATFQNSSMTENKSNDDSLASIEETLSCVDQQERLYLLYTIAVTTINVFTFTWGVVIHRFGTLKSKIWSMALNIVGFLLLGFASPGKPLFIVPGLILTGIGGYGVIIINMKVTAYLPRFVGMYAAILSGSADISVVTLRIVKLLHGKGISTTYIFIGLAILHFTIASMSAALHKTFENWKNVISGPEMNNELPSLEDENTVLNQNQMERRDQHSKSTLKGSICSIITISHWSWYSVLLTTYLIYIGTINARLQNKLPDKVSFLTDMLPYVMFGGILTSSIPGFLMEMQKKMYTGDKNLLETRLKRQVLNLFLASLLAVVLNMICFFGTEVSLYAEYVVLTVFKSFMFASYMMFIVSVFPSKYIAIIYAVGSTIAGVFSTVQYGIFHWFNLYKIAPFHVRIFLTVIAGLSLLHSLIVRLTANRSQ